MSTLRLEIDQDYVEYMGEFLNDGVFEESHNYIRELRSKIFRNGNISQLEYGWKKSIEIDVLEDNALEFVRECTNHYKRDNISDKYLHRLTIPVRIASAKKYKDNHVNQLFKQTKDYEEKQQMAETLNGLVSNTPDEIDQIEVLEMLYSAAINSMDGQSLAWVAINPVGKQMKEMESIDVTENDYFQGAGNSVFGTSQSVSLMEIVSILRTNYENNPTTQRPKFPSDKDKINNIYWDTVESTESK